MGVTHGGPPMHSSAGAERILAFLVMGGAWTIHEVCVRCGLNRHTDTWDQTWTGTGEPVETVRYEELT